jgi:hypothetical protein
VKADEIECGNHKAGRFLIGIQRCVFDTADLDDATFFEVLLTEANAYVHLVEDPRFAWFAWVPLFERCMSTDDRIEYNSYVNVNYPHKLAMPTWKLSRHSIVHLFKLCQGMKAEKKAKK